jgi:hypothetical protein
MTRNPARLVGALAFAILAFGTVMFIAGADADEGRRDSERISVSRLSSSSAYVRGVYSQQIGNDEVAIARAQEILNLAGQAQESRQLETFSRYCNVRQFLGDERACTGQTVGSAISYANTLPDSLATPVDGALEPKLSQSLSFSLASEAAMRQGTDELTWKGLRYEGAGFLRSDQPRDGAYVLVSGRNNSPWDLKGFEARLILRGADSRATLELRCNSAPRYPFGRLQQLTPGMEGIAYCEIPYNTELEPLVAAIHGAQQRGELMSIQVEALEIRNPPVRIERDRNDTRRFTVEATGDTDLGQSAVNAQQQVQHEIAVLDCGDTETCPSVSSASPIAFFEFLYEEYWLLPIAVGLLLGIGIGGLFRNPFRAVGILVAGVLAVTIAGLSWLFYAVIHAKGEAAGFAVLGFAKLFPLAMGGAILWVVAFCAGVVIVRPLWRATDCPAV